MQTTAALVAEWIVLIFIAGIGGIVLVKLWMGTIDLSGLLSEPSGGSTAVANVPATDFAQGGAGAGGGAVAARPGGGAAAVAPAGGVAAVATPAAGPGKASMSRLQLLLFTFIIAGLYLTLSFEAGYMIEIPNQVLGLLAISGASYVVSKGIQANKPNGGTTT